MKGNENIVADCLSRPTNTVMVDIFELLEIAKQQQDNVEIKVYKEKLQSYPLVDLQLYCDISTFNFLCLRMPVNPFLTRFMVYPTLDTVLH